MALMSQDELCVREVAARMGVPYRSLYYYLQLDRADDERGVSRPRPCRFPEQYLVCKMLDQETRERIMQPHHWAKRP